MTMPMPKAHSTLPAPSAAPPPAAEQDVFVINLCSSTTPMALTQPQLAETKRYTFFVTAARKATENLKGILRDLSDHVRQRTEGRPGLDGMGATVVLALIRGTTAFIAHMGDSRLYLFRKRRLRNPDQRPHRCSTFGLVRRYQRGRSADAPCPAAS